jgi:hypothetical protein
MAASIASASSALREWSLWPADDALRVGAGLRAAVDGGDHGAVAALVQQRGGERQRPAHVLEGVVADHGDAGHAAAQQLPELLGAGIEVADVPIDGGQQLPLLGDDLEQVTLRPAEGAPLRPAQHPDPQREDDDDDREHARERGRDDGQQGDELASSSTVVPSSGRRPRRSSILPSRTPGPGVPGPPASGRIAA